MNKFYLKPLLLCLFSFIGMARTFAHDIEVANADGKTIYYNYINNKTELAVTYRGSYYYSYNEYSGKVAIPEKVKYGGNTYSVTEIGDYAFAGCSGLTSVTIPNSVTEIGSYAFNVCSGLTEVSIPNSVTEIGSYAFNVCSGLTSVTIGNGVTSIGGNAFRYCSGLTSVTIGNSVTEIGYNAFYDCTALEKVIVPDLSAWCRISFDSNSYYHSNPLYYARHLYSDENTEITYLIIPDTVTSICDYLFYGCSSLTSVTIPSSVTSIGRSAFRNCSNLTDLTFSDGADTLALSTSYTSTWWEDPDYSEQPFDGCPIERAYLGRNLKYSCTYKYWDSGDYYTAYVSPFRNCGTLKEVTISNILTEIGYDAFYGCSGLTSVTIPNSVTKIGSYAFDGCSGLKSVTIGNSVTSIDFAAFSGCRGLTSVTIPSSVTEIGSYAFNGCSGLKSVTIPNSVTSIGDYAFYGCNALEKVIVPDLAAWCRISFHYNNSNPLYYAHHLYSDENTEITDLIIPNSVTSIGSYAFDGCSGLTSVTIPNSVTSIGGAAFSGCSGLTSVTIPNSVTSIGDYAFYGCNALEKVIVPDLAAWCRIYFDYNNSNPLYYAHHLYSDENTEITDLIIPNSVTSISYYAFYGCSGLTSVTIPNSVTEIGSYAFSRCI